MAFSAINAIKSSGKKCPNDISVLGYDGIEMGDFISPRLTTMRRPVENMGVRAVNILLGSKKEKRIKLQKIKAKLIIRDSCTAN